MNHQNAESFIDDFWEHTILPTLSEYVCIPCKSPDFDPQWAANGFMEQAVALGEAWCRDLALPGVTPEVVRLNGRTPVLLIEIDGDPAHPVLCYCHLDKQPEMSGWSPGLGPWQPKLQDGKLYGRGAADDGYAMFAYLAAVAALKEQNLAHGRITILIETCEESGSPDLPHYIEALAPRIGTPELVVVLDSGCGDYERLWCTTSLRGMTGGNLAVEVLSAGVHSGDASGIVPSTSRITRILLSRIEDEHNGAITGDAFNAEIPPDRVQQAGQAAAVMGDATHAKFPFLDGVRPVSDRFAELILNRTWRPALEITGAEGLPAIADAGNVLRPRTISKLSLRLSPTCDAARAADTLKQRLEHDPPYNARVRFTPEIAADGWNAPPFPEWLLASLEACSGTCFGKPPVFMGEGGTIPFLAMLSERFPQACFVITGVLGPHSNAHGPDEFLHIETARRITGCIARVLHDQCRAG